MAIDAISFRNNWPFNSTVEAAQVVPRRFLDGHISDGQFLDGQILDRALWDTF